MQSHMRPATDLDGVVEKVGASVEERLRERCLVGDAILTVDFSFGFLVNNQVIIIIRVISGA